MRVLSIIASIFLFVAGCVGYIKLDRKISTVEIEPTHVSMQEEEKKYDAGEYIVFNVTRCFAPHPNSPKGEMECTKVRRDTHPNFHIFNLPPVLDFEQCYRQAVNQLVEMGIKVGFVTAMNIHCLTEEKYAEFLATRKGVPAVPDAKKQEA